MLISLPTELWFACFDWLVAFRLLFAKKVNKLGDRQFSILAQTWLHVYTKNVKLGRLRITKCSVERSAAVGTSSSLAQLHVVGNDDDQTVPFPEVAIPDNITGFEAIKIHYLDAVVFRFLTTLRGLFDPVFFLNYYRSPDNLDLYPPPSHAALPLLMPLLGSNLYAHFHITNDSRSLFYEIPASLCDSILALFLVSYVDIQHEDRLIKALCRWLCSKRADGKPRCLYAQVEFDTDCLVRILQEQFRNACAPVSFFVEAVGDHDDVESKATNRNEATRELLVVDKKAIAVVNISRHPEAQPAWTAAQGNWWQGRGEMGSPLGTRSIQLAADIELCSCLMAEEVGTVVAAVEEKEEKEGKQDDGLQPGPSKRRKVERE